MIKKLNIFQILIVVAVFAIILRLFDLSAISTPASIAESTPAPKALTAVNDKHEEAAGSEEKKDKKDEGEAAPATTAEGDAKKEDAKSVDHATIDVPSYGEQVFSASEVDVLQSLAKRRDELDKRDKAIAERAAVLKAAEGEVDRKIVELNKIKGELEALLGQQEKVQDARITSLVKIYEGMKPKEAARIFDTLDMDVLLSMISRMSERKSSPILAAMDPDKARIVTIRLTEQRQLPSAPSDKTPAPAKKP